MFVMPSSINLPYAAREALRDLLNSLERDGIVPVIEKLPDGQTMCQWNTQEWMVSATIDAFGQTIRMVASKAQGINKA
ncbi:MAG: hypothetical protein IPH35_28155 [Rhodoferax sp.]|nr:hypothetical protein [Rhodoferax sp.]